MKYKNYKKRVAVAGCIGIVLGILSCDSGNRYRTDAVKTGTDMIFPRGEKVANSNFTGTVWVSYLAEADTVHNVSIGSVTFEPGARTNWHYHQGGQILMVTEGKGLYQEEGQPVEIIEKGAVMKCPPNVAHWHGATPHDTMTHIAIGTNTHIGGAVWLKPVTDEEYHSYHRINP